MAVVQQPVKDGGGDHGVSEQFSPLCKALVGCEDDAAPLIPGRDQAEEGGGGVAVVGPYAETRQ